MTLRDLNAKAALGMTLVPQSEALVHELDIFTAALAISTPAERIAFLDRVCADRPDLRRRLDELLAAHARSNPLDRGPGDLAATGGLPPGETSDLPNALPGHHIGPYKLMEQIGEGGMGTVWMAQQTEPVKRLVAVKLIKAGMDSRQVIARFEAERQALALMDHANIARVLEAGTTKGDPGGVTPGRPYFVMELVKGVPITRYCDEHRLTPRQRLELFIPVCQAIQHAHQKGIIHRDIKPTNVMITLYDGKPVPKVIDFGVAKATEQRLTERTLFTQYGTMVGTLEYVSPEQAEMSALGVDTRSDIYSLGVLLYELLTGNTPLSHKRVKDAAYAEILRLIKEEEPPKPSTRLSDSGEALASISAQRHMEPAKLTKLMRGELDWIVMKCLEKDRNRRYETANGFSDDVQRYLDDEPVQACPPSVTYRVGKFARRNKAAMSMGAVVTIAGLTLLSGALWHNWQLSAKVREVEAQRSAAAREAQRADGSGEVAERLFVQDQAAHVGDGFVEPLSRPVNALDEPGGVAGDFLNIERLLTAYWGIVRQHPALVQPRFDRNVLVAQESRLLDDKNRVGVNGGAVVDFQNNRHALAVGCEFDFGNRADLHASQEDRCPAFQPADVVGMQL
jgi:serine/threonine protein kinase